MARLAIPSPCLSALLLLAACAGGPPLAQIESTFQDTRTAADQIDVTLARALDTTIHGVPLDSVRAGYRDLRSRLLGLLEVVDAAALHSADHRALQRIQEVTSRSLTDEPEAAVEDVDPGPADCRYDPRSLLDSGVTALTERMFACYGRAAQTIVLDRDTLDRLTIFGLLGATDNRSRRRRLFMALEPVWRSVNGDGGPDSPWRLALARRAGSWTARDQPHVARAEALGVSPDSVEAWLVRVLEAWASLKAAEPIEPWDWYYQGGEEGRRLGDRVPRDRLLDLNHEHYRALGADPDSLNIQYDILPRPGKYPVAYTTFGARPMLAADRWSPGEPTVFASYRIGGLDNLGELLHETGHGVHLAAIRTRPAYADWPDSDTFTEAVADIVAHDLHEPAWQQRFLGDAVPLAVALRAKYAGVMLDVAWSLFEMRLFADPTLSPNQVWADITWRHLGIRPHAEWSWWAMRGQLVDSPGYMLNYALGAMVIAQVRDKVRLERGDPAAGDLGWYAWVSDRLFRFGRERPSREVLREFLGAPLSPQALLGDIRRAAAP